MEWHDSTFSIPTIKAKSESWYESEHVLVCTHNPSENYRYAVAYCIVREGKEVVWIEVPTGRIIDDVDYWTHLPEVPAE